MATRGQQKTKAELTKAEKAAEKKSAQRQAVNRERSKAEMERRTQSNSRLTKKELTAKEKAAEKKTAERQAANKEKSKAEMEKRTAKPKAEPKKGTRRAEVARRRNAEKNIPKRVRDMMVSEKTDRANAAQAKQNAGDAKVRTERRGPGSNTRGVQKPAPKSTLQNITNATKKVASRVGPMAKGVTAVGLGLTPNTVGVGEGESRSMAQEQAMGKRDEVLAGLKKQMAESKAAGNTARTKASAAKPPATKSDAPAGPPRTIAEAKRRGLDYFVGRDGKRKAAVTAEELKASGLTLREYLNKKQGKTAKMAKGGYANCGASMKPTQKSSKGMK